VGGVADPPPWTSGEQTLAYLGAWLTGGSRPTTLDFRRADFGLFRSLADRVPWELVLKGKGVQEGCTLFMEEVLKTQEQAILMCRNTSQQGRRPD